MRKLQDRVDEIKDYIHQKESLEATVKYLSDESKHPIVTSDYAASKFKPVMDEIRAFALDKLETKLGDVNFMVGALLKRED